MSRQRVVESEGPGIHQFVPVLHRADAVGRHTMTIQSLLRAQGIPSEIYVERDDPETVGMTRRAAEYRAEAHPGDVLIYQVATASGIVEELLRLGQPLVVNYHNLTPPEYFAPWHNLIAQNLVAARSELVQLADRTTLAIADSVFNERDLVELGYRRTAVVPPLMELPDSGQLAVAGRPAGRTRAARWLCVGRVAPNKALESAVNALMVYRHDFDPEATLLSVGRAVPLTYADGLRRYAADLGLAEAVTLAGSVSDARLAQAFEEADVLVVTSAHEGFCIPVVEAMAQGLPVVAFRQGAIPELLDDVGSLVESTEPTVVAEAVHRLQADPTWRQAVVEGQHRQLERLDLPSAGPRLMDLLRSVRDESAPVTRSPDPERPDPERSDRNGVHQ